MLPNVNERHKLISQKYTDDTLYYMLNILLLRDLNRIIYPVCSSVQS